MYPLNILIVIIKLLIIMGVNTLPITTKLPNSITQKSKDIYQHQQHNSALYLISETSTVTTTATASPMLTLLSSSPASLSFATTSLWPNSLRLRKRHRKRHSIWYDNNFYFNENSLEWSNPCGGEYHPNAKQPKPPTNKEQKRIYKNLRQTALNDFNYLNGSNQQDIDISNIEIWWLHNGTYKFLPKLKTNSSIALKRWYRNMQTYVATFAYLHRIQFKYDRSKSQRDSGTSLELKELLKSSRNMLCELETAVNKTYIYKKRQIPHITRLEMNQRLKLRTKQRFKDNANVLAEADSIDLKFVKFHYFEYLKNMWQLLKNVNRRKQQQFALQKSRKQLNRTLTHIANTNKQFNEVDKVLNQMQTKRNKKRKNTKSKHKLV